MAAVWPSRRRLPRISDWNEFFFFFHLQVILMLPTKFRVNWPKDVGGVGFLIKIKVNKVPSGNKEHTKSPNRRLGLLTLHDALCTADDARRTLLPTKFQVNWPVGPGEEAKK